MMGGGAFVLLKTGRHRPESAKQAEIRLAILLKILRIGRSCGEPGAAVRDRYGQAIVGWVRIPPGMANLPGNAALLSRSQF
jgi:hypothetical protein